MGWSACCTAPCRCCAPGAPVLEESVPGVVLPGVAVPLEGEEEGCCAGGVPPCCVPLCSVEDCCPPCCCPSGTLATLVEVTNDAAIIKAPSCPAKLFLMATSGGYCPDYTPLQAPSCSEFLGCAPPHFSFLKLVRGMSQINLAGEISAIRGGGALVKRPAGRFILRSR